MNNKMNYSLSMLLQLGIGGLAFAAKPVTSATDNKKMHPMTLLW